MTTRLTQSLAAGAIAVCVAPAGALAERCPPPGDNIRLVTSHAEVERNTTMSAAAIRQAAGADPAARHYPLLGMLGETFGYFIHVSGEVTGDDSGRFCVDPANSEITIRLGFMKRTFFIARDASDDACLLKTITRHLTHHRTTSERAFNEFLSEFKETLTEELRALRIPPAPTEDAARAALADALEQRLLPTIEKFEARKTEGQRFIDTPTELASLRTACGGRGQRLVW